MKYYWEEIKKYLDDDVVKSMEKKTKFLDIEKEVWKQLQPNGPLELQLIVLLRELIKKLDKK